MHNKKILLIDDDARNIFALSAVLRANGYHCVSAQSAVEGLALLEQQLAIIGLVLMDIMLPDIDGYQAIARIRAHPQLAAIPVIAVTAKAMTGDRQKSIAAGADAYVAKPVDVDVLLELLNQYLK